MFAKKGNKTYNIGKSYKFTLEKTIILVAFTERENGELSEVIQFENAEEAAYGYETIINGIAQGSQLVKLD